MSNGFAVLFRDDKRIVKTEAQLREAFQRASVKVDSTVFLDKGHQMSIQVYRSIVGDAFTMRSRLAEKRYESRDLSPEQVADMLCDLSETVRKSGRT